MLYEYVRCDSHRLLLKLSDGKYQICSSNKLSDASAMDPNQNGGMVLPLEVEMMAALQCMQTDVRIRRPQNFLDVP